MSKWKQQIDEEIGIEPRFTRALEDKILTLASTKKRKTFKPAFIYIATSLIVLLLFISSPKEIQKEHMASGSVPLALNNVVEQDKIKSVYISYIQTEENRFFARNTTFALGINRLSKKETMQLQDEFRGARLDYGTIVDEKGKLMVPSGYDAIVQFENGREKKLRIISGMRGTVYFDLDTKLMYSNSFIEKGVMQENFEKGILWGKVVIVILLISTYLLVCGNLKNRAPGSIRIFGSFISLLVIICLLLKFNINISIWVAVGYLIISCYIRYVKLRDSHYDEEKLSKLKRANWLLVMMWAIVLLQQLLGGI